MDMTEIDNLKTRYARQMSLPEVGEEGQMRLAGEAGRLSSEQEGWAQLSCPSLWERGSGISHYAMTIVSQ